MPSLHIHTHCQVAQKSKRTNQNLPKSMAVQPHGQTEKIKHGHTTRGHKTLGVRWLFESQFSHQRSLYLDSEVAPNSPTFHTAIRYKAYKKDDTTQITN